MNTFLALLGFAALVVLCLVFAIWADSKSQTKMSLAKITALLLSGGQAAGIALVFFGPMVATLIPLLVGTIVLSPVLATQNSRRMCYVLSILSTEIIAMLMLCVAMIRLAFP